VEGQEWCDAHDDDSEMIVPLVQPSKNVEDEIAAREHAAQIAKGEGHALHLVAVVAHREVTL
jgi:hypothetical protein